MCWSFFEEEVMIYFILLFKEIRSSDYSLNVLIADLTYTKIPRFWIAKNRNKRNLFFGLNHIFYLCMYVFYLKIRTISLFIIIFEHYTMGKKNSTDNTLKMLGFHYQYLIVIDYALSTTSEEDTILIEKVGDFSTNQEIVEIKHHTDSNHILSNNHIDFWKTLSNFKNKLKDIREYEYKRLILLTTSIIKEDSSFYNWNNKKADEKLRVLENIKSSGIPDGIEKYVSNIFTFDNAYSKDDLKYLLKMFIINENHLDFSRKINRIIKYQALRPIKDNELKRQFIFDCFGFLIKIMDPKTGEWAFRLSDFYNFYRMQIRKYQEGDKFLPSLLPNELNYDSQKYSSRNFVRELVTIEIKNRDIVKAVDNYHKYNLTHIKLIDSDISFISPLEEYDKSIVDNLQDLREIAILDRLLTDTPTKVSQKLYYKSNQIELKNIEGISHNLEYFQKGVIHQIVDDGRHTWLINFEDNEY